VANRVRGILEKTKGVRNSNLVFDTTGVGYFDVGKETPELAVLNKAIEDDRVKGVKITKLEKVDVAKHAAVSKVTVKGLA
jgi:hypothetical protein